MMPPRSQTADFLPTLRDNLSEVVSNTSSSVQMVFPHGFDRQWSNPIMTALSPPPAAAQPQRKKSHLRLRSDSGLALHTNQAAFRQYTDYSADGSLPVRPCHARTLSFDGNSSVEDFSLGIEPTAELRGFMSNGRVLPDFFEPAMIKLVFSNQGTVRRLRAFAEARHDGPEIDFLLKVEEYSRALGCLVSSMSYISSNFTSTTATSPLGLTPEVANALNLNIKYCSRTALPALDKMYQEAKSAAEERLSQNLYPEFVKYQLSRCLIASLSATRPLTGETSTPYRGLGDAFCLTDPLQPDNPIVVASDGLLILSGYRRTELVGKNCRLLQGVATDPEAPRRLGQALAAARETTTLILNYQRDGTPFWNLLFICPLMENGIVRYFFGAQVDISENMASDAKDIMGVLNFGRPPESSPVPASPTSTNFSTRQSSDNLEPGQTDDPQDQKRPSRSRRFFQRFRRGSPSSRPSSPSRPNTASATTTDDTTTPVPPPSARCFPPLSPRVEHHPPYHQHHPQLLDEHSTPYSRFLVMRFDSPPTPSPQPPFPPPSRSTTTTAATTAAAPRRGKLQTDRRPAKPRDRDTLPIAFCSRFALKFLGLRAHEESHAVIDQDIFSVLSSRLGSPSINRVFRRDVVGKLTRGESVSADLVMVMAAAAAAATPAALGQGGSLAGEDKGRGRRPGVMGAKTVGSDAGFGFGTESNNHSGPGSGSGLGSGFGAGGAVCGRDGGVGEGRPRLSETLERGAEFFSQTLFSSSSTASSPGPGKGGLKRVVSTWVPLKDATGKVAWAVLVLTPVEEGSSV